MPRPKADPVETALEAYFALDTDQVKAFTVAIKHVERFAAKIGHAAGAPAPKRGRPQGSKNKANSSPELMKALGTLLPNAASEEGL